MHHALGLGTCSIMYKMCLSSLALTWFSSGTNLNFSFRDPWDTLTSFYFIKIDIPITRNINAKFKLSNSSRSGIISVNEWGLSDVQKTISIS